MSLFETPLSCGVRALSVSVSEVLVRVGEDILGLLERRTGSCGSGGATGRLLRVLRPLLTERLAAAAHRIIGLLERELEESRRQLERQSRLLEAVLSPVVRLPRADEIRPIPSDCSPAHISETPPIPTSFSPAETDDDWRGSEDSNSDKQTIRLRIRARDMKKPVVGVVESHRCVICGKGFRHKRNLVKHVETHCDNLNCLCGVCGEDSETSHDLVQHLHLHREMVSGGTCDICGKMFQNMETHMRSHTGVKPYTCDICNKSFPRPGALRRHQKIHSRTEENRDQSQDHVQALQLETHKEVGEANRFEGDQCNTVDPKSDTDGRLSSQRSMCCRVCGDSFHSKGFLRKHAEMHLSSSPSICGVCGQQVDSADRLLTHLQSHRVSGGICSICGKRFQNMETHMRSHTGVKPYRCVICAKRFPRPGALRRHKKIHTGERPHVCQRCGKAFIESSALKMHRCSHTSDEPTHGQTKEPNCQTSNETNCETEKTICETTENINCQTAIEKVAHGCKVCGELFPSKAGLRKHAESHSSGTDSICGVCGEHLATSESLMEHLDTHRDTGKICHICGKTYQNIETHMRSHTGIKPYRCNVCGKTFPRPGALRRHRRIHSGERPYICEFCGKTFVDNSALTTHIRKHTGDKPASRVPCEVCGKSLASVHVLEVHRRIHTGEKPFECQLCGRAFRQVGGLNAHMLTHTGEKPYGCSICGKSFSTKGYLETHLRFHRKERAFSCHLCWKAFVTKNDLKKHLLTHSGEKPFSCRVCGKSYQEKRSRDVHMKVHSNEPIRRQDGDKPVRREEDLQCDLTQL
ncbi:zinc finger protein 665-like isoform X2 [Sphaeramia orbicularis]|uniref:zinc finger protein 665-like isoform X2 n=1 Tax=Sphaeramia orbicularis TaxID=375764 RepID=UPI00117E0D2A|nr:zinc finger protein 665-like isoform X2 [Sphaeramia orbicularis]